MPGAGFADLKNLGCGVKSLFIHATNVTGLGATSVVKSLLEAFLPLASSFQTEVCLPPTGALSQLPFNSSPALRKREFKRKLPNNLSRVIECLGARWLFGGRDGTLVLGDLPLYGLSSQIVFVHQAHLASPRVNPYVGRSLNFRVARQLFRFASDSIDAVIVQGEPMAQDLLSSYPRLEGRISVLPQPHPPWLQVVTVEIRKKPSRLKLFYPSAAHPHKNHLLIRRMIEAQPNGDACVEKLMLTLTEWEFRSLGISANWVHNLGRISSQNCLQTYQHVDALFFPSLLESYGLPLVEAMSVGLPIVCSDLPFARWLCGDQAIYFDGNDPNSSWTAIRHLHHRLNQGWRPDWVRALSKLPRDWEKLAREFLEVVERVLSQTKN